jgi:hypothetical protein
MSWKSGARAIDKLERHTVVAGTFKQELLKRQYVVFGSECVKEEDRGLTMSEQQKGGEMCRKFIFIVCSVHQASSEC